MFWGNKNSRTVEIVREGEIKEYILEFFKERKVPFSIYTTSSETGEDLRALFSEKEDARVLPCIIVSQGNRVLFQKAKPRLRDLYNAVRIYEWGDEALEAEENERKKKREKEKKEDE